MFETTTILLDLIFILLHFFLFLFNYKISNGKVYQPSVLFSLIWFIIISLHCLFRFTILNELYPLTLSTYLIFLVGVISFSLGSLVVNTKQNNTVSSEDVQDHHDININLWLRIIFVLILLIGLPFYIQAAFKLFIASESENFFQGLRHEISYGDLDIGPTKYLLSFSFVVLAICLYSFATQRNAVNRILLITCLLVTITYAVFATGRTFFFLILTLYFGISFLHNKNFSLKKNIWLVFVFIPLFMAYGVIYGKGGDTESTLQDNLQSSSENVAVYMVTPLNAFDIEYKNFHQPNFNGDNTLRFFVKIGQQLNLFPNRKVSELLQEFIFVPYSTNVYTYYSPYIRDYGLFYAFMMLFLFGMLHTWLCNKAVGVRTFRFTLYYSFLLFPLLMTFFQDQYLSLFSTWVQMIVFIETTLFLNRLILNGVVSLKKKNKLVHE